MTFLEVDESGLDSGELIAPYVESLIDGIIAACRSARDAATDCTVAWGYGHCDLAGNRDLPTATRDLCGFNPAIAADDVIAVGRISDRSGHVVATVVNYACHATTLAWQNSLISRDYIGAAREVVENALGEVCLFLQGASGELGPKRQYTGDVTVADENGRCLGYAALAATGAMPPSGSALAFTEAVECGAPLGTWETVPADPDTTLAFARTDVSVPVKPEMTADEVAHRWPQIDRLRPRSARAARNGCAPATPDACRLSTPCGSGALVTESSSLSRARRIRCCSGNCAVGTRIGSCRC